MREDQWFGVAGGPAAARSDSLICGAEHGSSTPVEEIAAAATTNLNRPLSGIAYHF